MGNRLVGFLGEYIKGRLREKAGAREGAEFRCSFSGPTVALLEQVLGALVEPGQALEVEGPAGPRKVSVYLVDASVSDPSEMVRSGRCTVPFVVKARTARQVSEFLALHRLGEAINLTLDSTVEPIGFNGEPDSPGDWLAEPLVDELLEMAVSRYEPNAREATKAALARVLEVTWPADERYQDKPSAWSTLERLANGAVQGRPGDHLDAAMALGLPACASGDFGKKTHLGVLQRVGEIFVSQGLAGGFEQFKRLALAERPELVPHLEALYEHVHRSCFEASEFVANPFAAYAPPPGAAGHPPGWWEALDLTAWIGLLDSNEGEQEDLDFNVVLGGVVAPELKGLPALIESSAHFDLEITGDQEQVVIAVSMSNGSARFEPLSEVPLKRDEPLGLDFPVPPHKRFVRFKFEPLDSGGAVSESHAKSIKLIALDSYEPGIVAYSRTALKATPFKLNGKAKENGKVVQRFECDMELAGTGTHQVDFFKGKSVKLGPSALGYEVTNDDDEVVERPVNLVSQHHATCLVESDEECYYDFWFEPAGAGERSACRLFLTADEGIPTGANSEFDRLVIEHRAAAKGKHANTRVESMANRLQDLETGALSTRESYRPLVLGPDFLEAWRQPSWENHDTLSGLSMILDPRPSVDQLVAPDAFITAREVLRTTLRGDETRQAPSIQMLRLHEYAADPVFVEALLDYLAAYLEWLQADYTAAAWCDVVSVHASQGSGGVLETKPYAFLLSPLHPVRLAWQCRSQEVLQLALQQHLRCPAASIVQPSAFPDCMALPVASAAGGDRRVPFVAMASTSDYWSVLWATDELDRMNAVEPDPVFSGALGVEVEGLGSGFSEQQVARAMDEVSRLVSARSTLSVALSSETSGTSGCNEGLESWARGNLAEEADAWHEAGGRFITVHDERPVSLQPEPATLAGLTAATGSAARWFSHRPGSEKLPVDLAIVAQLGTANREFGVHGLRSAVDATVLSRVRLRKQLPQGGANFVAESRVGAFPLSSIKDPLARAMASCLDLLERTCAEEVDAYIFAPQMAALGSAIERSSYTAVSSSNLDTACFLGTSGKAYLWDYELPSYGRRPTDNCGYFLLASKSPAMTRAMRSAVTKLSAGADLAEEKARDLLDEVSRRGMPTLKRLTSGGTMSLGEAGLLVALRFLQTEFDGRKESAGLVPALGDDGTVNLVVPADPFANQFDDLRVAFEGATGERPDLLVMSLLFRQDRPLLLKVTPVEVKARATATLSAADRASAIRQARKFAEFLDSVRQRAEDSDLWGLAWFNLASTLLDYGFRVYGQLDQFMTSAEWSRVHQGTMAALLARDLPVVVDDRGRLVVIDSTSKAKTLDDDNDGFAETLVMSREEAYSLLQAPGGQGLVESAKRSMGNWELVATEEDVPLEEAGGQPGTREHESSTAVLEEKTAPAGHVAGEEDGGAIEHGGEASRELPQGEAIAELCEHGNGMGDTAAAGIEFAVGRTSRTLRDQEVFFRPGNTALNQLNVGIVGDLGTGKTQLVQALVYQLRCSAAQNRQVAPNVLIFDYKRDYSKPEFAKAVGARVVEPFDLPLNMFDTRNASQARNAWLERYKFFADVLGKIYGGIGPVQQERIKVAVKAAFDGAAGLGRPCPTLREVFESYKDADAKIDSPYSIMSDLVDSEIFVEDPAKVIPFEEFARGVTVINLAEVGQDDRTKNMIVAVFLNLFYEHMLKIEKRKFIGRDPSYRFVDTVLLVDEADNIMKYEFDVLRKILLQGREFGVGVLLASQYLSHFRTAHENYLEPLLTWFIHKVPDVKVNELAGIGLAHAAADMVDAIKTLEVHHCLVKTLGVEGEIVRAYPFYELVERLGPGI